MADLSCHDRAVFQAIALRLRRKAMPADNEDGLEDLGRFALYGAAAICVAVLICVLVW